VYRLGSVVSLLLGIFALVMAYSLRIGEFTRPGPGLWPFLISVTIVLSSIALLATERDARDYERLTARTKFIVFGLLALGVFILLFLQIGFIIPGFLTFVFWFRFLSREPWGLTLIIAVLCTAGFYIVFDVLLGVPFPEDIVASLWGG
jgi:putative tricarboxylic transport membrane protein